MGHETVVADCDSEAADEIEQCKQGPVNPRVVIQVAVEWHSHDRTEHHGGKQEDRPTSVVAPYDCTGNICVLESRDIWATHRIVS